MVGVSYSTRQGVSFHRGAIAALAIFSTVAAHAARASGNEGLHKSRLVGPASAGADVTKSQEIVEASPSAMRLTPSAARFADVPVGETYTQMVRIENTGTKVVLIQKIIAPTVEFKVSGVTLPFVIAGGTAASFTVSYHPTAPGKVTGEMRILTSEGNARIGLELAAWALEVPQELTASEASVDFADVTQGSRRTKQIAITNTGNREVKISKVSVTGADFSVSGPQTVTLGPGQSVQLMISLASTGLGPHSGKLIVVSDDSAGGLQIPLSAARAANSQSAIRLKWEDAPTVAGYMVYRAREANGPYERLSDAAIASTEYIDDGLAAGRTYYYVVTYVDADAGESEYSAPISATVPEG